jgi:hypothetical protein
MTRGGETSALTTNMNPALSGVLPNPVEKRLERA